MSVSRSCILILFTTLLLPVRAGSLDDALAKFQPASLTPGYGICLFDAKGEIWSRYEGEANEATGVPFSRDTLLRIGGVSELFTLAMAMQLVDAGLLDPDQPVAAYLPEMFAGAPAGSPLARVGRLTIRLLMSHLSGTDANFFLGFRDYDPFLNLRDYLNNVNLKYPPATKYLRSGAMIDLLGVVIEKASGKRFEELARTALFEPMGMAASSFRYQDSPLFASLRYKSAAPDSYATRISGFREVVAPSGSMQSSLSDLVRFFSALLPLRSETGTPLLSPASRQAMFASQSEAVALRQGLRIGYVWKLSLPELAYLGRVAWYSGKHLSHRNVVVLLPELGIGAVCATNAWSIFDRETILPVAVEILKTYARDHLKHPEPAPFVPVRVPMSRQLRAQVSGSYASPSGVYHIQPKGDAIQVFSSALDMTLEYVGEQTFRPGMEAPLDRLTLTSPDSISLFMRNGRDIEAQRVRPSAGCRTWLKRLGTYRIALPTSGALYAFSLSSFEGLPVISGDDGTDLLLEPLTQERASVRCDESSRFFDKAIQVSGPDELRLDGIPYRRNH